MQVAGNDASQERILSIMSNDDEARRYAVSKQEWGTKRFVSFCYSNRFPSFLYHFVSCRFVSFTYRFIVSFRLVSMTGVEGTCIFQL